MAIAVRGQVSEALDAYKRRGWLLDELLASLRRRSKLSVISTVQDHTGL